MTFAQVAASVSCNVLANGWDLVMLKVLPVRAQLHTLALLKLIPRLFDC